MKTLQNAIDEAVKALYYGNRLLLPFKVDILKIVIENDIITNFNSDKHDAKYFVRDSFTEIYFNDFKDIGAHAKDNDIIKMTVVEKGNDLFDTKKHIAIGLTYFSGHQLNIDKLDDEILYFE